MRKKERQRTEGIESERERENKRENQRGWNVTKNKAYKNSEEEQRSGSFSGRAETSVVRFPVINVQLRPRDK